MMYGLWQEDIQEWVYVYECVDEVYEWNRLEFIDKDFAEFYCAGEGPHVIVKEID